MQLTVSPDFFKVSSALEGSLSRVSAESPQVCLG